MHMSIPKVKQKFILYGTILKYLASIISIIHLKTDKVATFDMEILTFKFIYIYIYMCVCVCVCV